MRAARLVGLLGVAACAHSAARAPTSAPNTSTTPTSEIDPSSRAPEAKESPRRRSVGFVVARVPGTDDVVDGVSITGHRVSIDVRGGFARTEIEEDLSNDGDRVLEGRYVFTLPPDASLSRLALWVDDKLVEGEIVERARARAIYQGIVDDTLRPRDPALLERDGGRLSLRVFPIPPHGKRTVLLAYDTLVPSDAGRAHVPIPLPAPSDGVFQDVSFVARVRGSGAGDARIEPAGVGAKTTRVDGEAVVRGASLGSPGDISLSMPAPSKGVRLDGFPASAAGAGYFALRVVPPSVGRVERAERAIVLDRSYAQAGPAFDSMIELTIGALRRARGAFVVLACDSGCASFPTEGTATGSDENLGKAERWLRSLEARGSSDLAAAIAEGASRLAADGQLVYLGSGVSTSGATRSAEIAARIATATPSLDVRLIGSGARLDEPRLIEIARLAGAHYERAPSELPPALRAERVADGWTRPILRNVKLALPAAFAEVHPPVPATVRAGDPLVLFGRVREPIAGDVRLDADLVDAAGARTHVSVGAPARFDDATPNAVLPRLWAEANIATLEATPGSDARIRELSKTYRVASRVASFLVLENDAMFARFGIERTEPVADAWGLGLSGASSASNTTIGHAWGTTPETAPRTGSAGSHTTHAPQIRSAAVEVNGRVPPEIIQRVVRQSFGRFRACYQQGLMRDPSLHGRVAIRFLIDRAGEVPAASDAGSELPDRDVVACVARAFTSLTFPAPEGGVIHVAYPIVFTNDASEVDSPVMRSPLSAVPRSRAPASWGTWSVTTTPATDADLATPEAPTPRGWSLSGTWPVGARRTDLQNQLGALLYRGSFDEALAFSRRWAAADTTSAVAQRMLAYSAALWGDDALHAFALDSAVDAAPESLVQRTDAARAFEHAGDERRACAHWRALSDASPWGGEAQYQALRCRARLGDTANAVRETKSAVPTDPRVVKLVEALERGDKAPAYDGRSEGDIEARLTCAARVAHCPELAIVAPSIGVFLRAEPGAPNALVKRLQTGKYYTVAIGGDPGATGTLTFKSPSGTTTLPLGRGGRTHVVAVTVVK